MKRYWVRKIKRNPEKSRKIKKKENRI